MIVTLVASDNNEILLWIQHNEIFRSQVATNEHIQSRP